MLSRALLSRSLHGIFACGLIAAFAVSACSDHRPVGPLRDGDVACQDIVEHCADPVAALGESYQACYQTGADGDGDACLRVHDDCVESCRAARESLGGAGGQGGQGEAGAPGSGGASGQGGSSGAGATGEAGTHEAAGAGG